MLSGPEGESAATMARYSRFRADFPAIGIANGQKRKAADLPGLWNLLGRVGTVREYRVGGEDLNYAWPMTRGVGGMEAKLNPYLCGEPGIEALTVGALGLSRFAQGEVRPATNGRAVHLTLDCRIQNLAERYLLPSGAGAVMVVEVGSMKVRASVTGESADYSPSAEEYRGFESEPGGALLDWPRFWRTPPGSTFKMVTITAALMSGKLTPDERFHCPGYCMVGGVRRKCSHIHGWVNAEEALAGSCNVFTYRAAQRVGGDMVHRWARTMGFGRELPTEAYAPDIARSGLMSASHWGETGLWNLCIGQGETNVTVAGLAMYICALRNRELRTLVYVEPVGLSESEQEALGPHRLGSVPIREDVWDVISSGMRRCTEEGTARSARVSGVDILAKTGTAEIGGKHKNGLLVALVPAQEPKYCIVCAAADSEFSGGKMFGRRLHEFVGALLDAKLLPSTPDIAREDR
jgi:penicillin-binding protein 2